MALSDYFYTDGTITVTNGSTAIVGTGTAWQLRHAVGAILFVDENFGFVASVEDESHATLTQPWAGPTGTSAYTMWLVTAEASQNLANNQRLSEIIQSLDPAQPVNDNLTAISNLVGALDMIMVFTGPGTFRLAPKSEFTNGAEYDRFVNTLAARATYDLQLEGFTVLVADVGDGRSAIYAKESDASADWSDPAYLTGPIGLTPNLTIGTTTTLAPGSAATATITGTDEDPVLNLGIPAGKGFDYVPGGYNPATAYVLGDVARDNGSAWILTAPTSIGNAPPVFPVTANAYWELLAVKGTDGTGTGDVVGPASAIDGLFAIWDGVTGKLLKAAQALMTNINYNGFPLNGGVVRNGVDRLAESLSVKDFGALGDNSTDDTAALVTAIAAASARGQVPFFPSGIYRYTALGNIPPNVKLWGASEATTFLRKTTATGNSLSLNGGSSGVDGITFDATVTQTAGSFINITSNTSRATIKNVGMVGAFRGIIIPSSISIVDLIDVDINETVAGTGVDIQVNGGFAVSFTRVRCRNNPANRPFAHLNVSNVEDLTLTDCQFISAGINLNVQPGSGQHIGLITSAGSQFDDAGTVSINIAPTTGGVVGGVVIEAPWIKGGTKDVFVDTSGGGTVNGVRIIKTTFTGTASGFEANGGSNLSMESCWIGSHTVAAVSWTNVSGGQIQNNRIGPHDVYGGNNIGIFLGGNTDNVLVTGNDLRGNTTAINNLASGSHNEIRGNLGYPAMGAAGIGLTGSPMIITAGSTPEKITINAATTIPLVEIDDGAGGGFSGILQNMGAAMVLELQANQRMRLTYTGSPTILRLRCK